MKPHILFLASTASHERILKDEKEFDLTFLKVAQRMRRNKKQEQLLPVLDRARSLIETGGIDALYTSSDLGALFLGLLCDEYGYPGPTFLSVFACYHKYATRLQTKSPVDFALLDTNLPLEKQELLPFPFYLKAPQSAFGILGHTINSAEQLRSLWPRLCEGVRQMNTPLLPIYERYLDRERFAFAFRHVLLMESHVRAPQVTLEGYVLNEKFTPLIMTDTVFDSRHFIDHFLMPSTRDKPDYDNVCKQAAKDVMDVGLDNTFCNLEYWITKDGPQLIEVNPRPAATFRWLYLQTAGIDLFRSGFHLALGNNPDIRPQVSKAGGQFNLITEQEGRAGNLIDFQLLQNSSYRYLLATHKDAQVRQLSEHGSVLAQLEITGGDTEDVRQKADVFRRQLYLNQEM